MVPVYRKDLKKEGLKKAAVAYGLPFFFLVLMATAVRFTVDASDGFPWHWVPEGASFLFFAAFMEKTTNRWLGLLVMPLAFMLPEWISSQQGTGVSVLPLVLAIPYYLGYAWEAVRERRLRQISLVGAVR